MTKKIKVEQFYNKNQFIIRTNEKIIFQSYDSTIAEIDLNTRKIKLFTDWDYSNTTRKHLYLFISENFYFIYNIDRGAFYEAKSKRQFLQQAIDNKKIKYINK